MEEILNKIVPTNEIILSNLYETIKDVTTFDNLKNIFDKFQLDFNNFNETDFKYLYDIIQKNKVKKTIDTILKITEKNKTDQFSDCFYNYKNIQSNKIKKLYGDYPLLFDINDSLISRIHWIENQKDHGNIFYDSILLENNSNLKEHIRLVEKNLKQLKEPSGKTKSIYKVRIIQEVDSEKDLVTDYIPKLPTDKLLFNGNIYFAKSKKKTTKWILDEEKYSKGDKALFVKYLISKEYEFDGNKWIFKKKLLPHIQFFKKMVVKKKMFNFMMGIV